ncbi:MAG TPA: imidazoleglycerol-phosphate dehydratase HisB [Balneolaceae bacterium]|nr:imidazoleglycerol-phosphate dehydratase HisB [Balneolaceae bacterium]
MKIWISKDAICGKDENMLRSEALYGLKRLQELGHDISFTSESLSSNQQNLLENEQITSNGFVKDKADLFIQSDQSTLKACNHDGDKIESAENWTKLSNKICFPSRRASNHRKTAETDINIKLNLDGKGQSTISTRLGFFDHMLEQIAKHGLIDLAISCKGDLHVDEHHTIEDVAITLGETIRKALDKKIGIQRYGFTLPMDETLANIALDLSGRPYLVFEANFNRDKVGDLPTEMVEHFFYSLAINLKATLHITVKGDNDHHKIEACFKGFAHCLRAAVSRSERNANILPSTKDLL